MIWFKGGVILIFVCLISAIQCQDELAEQWKKAVKLSKAILAQRDNQIDLEAHMAELDEVSKEVLRLNRQRKYPSYATNWDKMQVRQALEIYDLSKISESKCLRTAIGPGVHYVASFSRLISRRFRTNKNIQIEEFMNEAYRRQLNLCLSKLAEHFQTQTWQVVNTAPESVNFVTHLIRSWLENTDISNIQDMERFLVSFFVNFYGLKSIKFDMSLERGLENRISQNFLRKCKRFVLNPLNTLVATLEQCPDEALKEQIKSEYGNWLKAYDLCNLMDQIVDVNWAERIYKLFPEGWGQELYRLPVNRHPQASKRRRIEHDDDDDADDSEGRHGHEGDDNNDDDDDPSRPNPVSWRRPIEYVESDTEAGPSRPGPVDLPTSSTGPNPRPLSPSGAIASDSSSSSGGSVGAFPNLVERMLSNLELSKKSDSDPKGKRPQ